MSLRILLAHSKWMILELARQPAYIVSTLAFPALFYWIFAIPESNDQASANFLMASFAGFAVMGVVFLQFGVGLAQERTRSWHKYLKTLPVNPWTLLGARFISAFLFAILASLTIVAMALTMTDAKLAALDWLTFAVGLITGGLTFGIMGLGLGYWASEKASLPLGNLIYLPLSFAGGLWKPPTLLPSSVKTVSEYLPTRSYGEILWAIVQTKPVEARHISSLAIYMLIFALIAYLGFRRDMDRRMRL